MDDVLTWCGNVYRKRQEGVPCPMPGHEDTTIIYSSSDGKPAVWQDGVEFIKESLPVANSVFRWWERI